MHPLPIDLAGQTRVESKTAQLNGSTYHYLLGTPEAELKGTIFLIHGWPDLSIGWRNQINGLIDLGLRVVVPDMMGYGGTDAPDVPPESIALYSFKRAADDIKELANQLGAPHIILGGHDWGGAIVFRVCLHHPGFVTHLFSVCTPYSPPTKEYYPLEMLVKGPLPNFTYQVHLAGPEVEAALKTKADTKRFLNGLYGAKGPNGEVAFKPSQGILLENLPVLGESPLLSEKELEFYADQYARNGMHGPLNWYRTREQNFNDEKGITNPIIDIPVLFITATRDAALPPAMAKGMEKVLPNLTKREVNSNHWALWEAPRDINEILKEWLDGVYFRAKAKI